MTGIVRVLIPCGIVSLALLAAIVSFLLRPAGIEFDALLKQIATDSDPSGPLREADLWIVFQEKHIQPEIASPEASLLADAYFNVGEALYRREDAAFLPAALDRYKKSVVLYPPIHHGWGYYQMGRIYEHNQQWEEAKRHYDMVSEYDSGFLALQAGYRKAKIQCILKEEVDAKALYDFVRYHRDGLISLAEFEDAVFSDTHESLALKGFFSLDLFRGYLQVRPLDRLAQFFVSPETMEMDWDLLEDYYAQRVIKNGGVTLLEGGHFIADLYGKEKEGSNVYSLEGEIENLGEAPVTVYFSLANQQKQIKISGEERIRFDFEKCNPREILDVYFESDKQMASTTRVRHGIQLKKLRCSSSSMETNS